MKRIMMGVVLLLSLLGNFSLAKDAPKAPSKATLVVLGAHQETIYLDGTKVGVAPYTAEVPPGVHYLDLSLSGCSPETHLLKLTAGQTQTIRAHLSPQPYNPKSAVKLRTALVSKPSK